MHSALPQHWTGHARYSATTHYAGAVAVTIALHHGGADGVRAAVRVGVGAYPVSGLVVDQLRRHAITRQRDRAQLVCRSTGSVVLGDHTGAQRMLVERRLGEVTGETAVDQRG